MALGTLQGSNSSAMNNIAKPGCQPRCGNITVPYPFGIGKDTDINECLDKSNIHCYGNCVNTEGSYNCSCWPGYTGNAKTQDGCQPVAKGSQFPVMIFTLGNLSFSQDRPGESRSLSTEEGLFLENVDNRGLDGPEEQLVAVANYERSSQ
ncbi:EGF-like domain-containing protein [Artemisia annua]|uniref:EGF-like domain-containing protein n=1 Tax=Artemisia annua TaxID=35608 RepID=A0A2U1QC42_ARTAN|nr:EGF-like domain-containing protein [Artemisia annua]